MHRIARTLLSSRLPDRQDFENLHAVLGQLHLNQGFSFGPVIFVLGVGIASVGIVRLWLEPAQVH